MKIPIIVSSLLILLLWEVCVRAEAFISTTSRIAKVPGIVRLPTDQWINKIHQDDVEKQNDTSFRPSDEFSLSSKYNLLTVRVWVAVLGYTTLLLVLDKVVRTSNNFSIPLLKSLHCSLPRSNLRVLERIILPLLASSCCAIQITINLISGIGCVGFNSILGKFRPYFVSILLYSTISNIPMEKSKFIIPWLVTLMPEMVHFINKRNQRKQTFNKNISQEETDLTHQVKLNIDVLDMGCVACINKIESTLRHTFDNIINLHSYLHDNSKGGEVSIKLSVKKNEIKSVTNDIINAIEVNGFKCKLKQ